MKIDFSFVPKHYAARTHEKMKEVLMDPNGIGPAVHYHLIRGGIEQKNLTVWEPGTISGEYIKTYGHVHVGKIDETYRILQGEGIVILQKFAMDKDEKINYDVVEEFKVWHVKPGDEIYMAPGWAHAFANTGTTYFVTVDNSPVDFGDKDPSGMPGHADYEPLKKMRGFAYYVVEHEGKPALEMNPKYIHTQILKSEFNGIPVIK